MPLLYLGAITFPADNIVPLSHAEWFVPRLKDATLYVRPGESHLGGLGIAAEVLDHVTRW